jgi:Cof subfamily protein (haloacid dehalogenase superfamily)
LKYEGIALFSDMDGTLLDRHRKLSDENIEAINYFINNGGCFGVATGRMERTTVYKFPQLRINTPSIFFNGALIYDTNKKECVHSVFMHEGMEPMLQYVFDNYPSAGIEINTEKNVFVLRNNRVIRSQLEREGISDWIETTWQGVSGKWFKVLIADKRETLKRVKEDLSKFNREDIRIFFSEDEILDIISTKASKGKALQILRDMNRNKWRLVFAVGDNDNDIDMIESADIGIAVSNGRPGVKAAARHEIANHNEPCIPQTLRIIDKYL